MSDRDVANQSGADILPDSAAGAASSGLRIASVSAGAQAVPIPAKSIAVLPFVSMSAGKDDALFADGLRSEEIINSLTRVHDLRVAARTSSVAFRETNDAVSQIAAKLHVATVMEGSVRRAGRSAEMNGLRHQGLT